MTRSRLDEGRAEGVAIRATAAVCAKVTAAGVGVTRPNNIGILIEGASMLVNTVTATNESAGSRPTSAPAGGLPPAPRRAAGRASRSMQPASKATTGEGTSADRGACLRQGLVKR